MSSPLTTELQSDLIKRGFSRRSFGKIASLITAGAAVPFFNEPALAQLSMVKNMPPDAVKINANENPLGPCPEAAEAIYGVVKKGGRYMYEDTFALASPLSPAIPVTNRAPTPQNSSAPKPSWCPSVRTPGITM
jgi:histidinol-phosphate aminotransferase